MPRFNHIDAKAILAIADSVKPPTQTDINNAKIAAMTCSTTKEFAEFLDIKPMVFKLWCNKYPSYYKAVLTWRDRATSEVEAAMAKRAIGFKKTTYKDVITKAGNVETLRTETYYPPDPTAAQFWLKNRAPADWKDAQQIDVNVNTNIRAWLVDASRAAIAGDGSETIDMIEGEFKSIGDDKDFALIEDQTSNEIQFETLNGVEPLKDIAPLEPETTAPLAPLYPSSQVDVSTSVEAIESEIAKSDSGATSEAANNLPLNPDPFARLNASWGAGK